MTAPARQGASTGWKPCNYQEVCGVKRHRPGTSCKGEERANRSPRARVSKFGLRAIPSSMGTGDYDNPNCPVVNAKIQQVNSLGELVRQRKRDLEDLKDAFRAHAEAMRETDDKGKPKAFRVTGSDGTTLSVNNPSNRFDKDKYIESLNSDPELREAYKELLEEMPDKPNSDALREDFPALHRQCQEPMGEEGAERRVMGIGRVRHSEFKRRRSARGVKNLDLSKPEDMDKALRAFTRINKQVEEASEARNLIHQEMLDGMKTPTGRPVRSGRRRFRQGVVSIGPNMRINEDKAMKAIQEKIPADQRSKYLSKHTPRLGQLRELAPDMAKKPEYNRPGTAAVSVKPANA